jgi:hypothetical protein
MKSFPCWLVIICVAICFLCCKKEPQKGDYSATFIGSYTSDSAYIDYTTKYYFEVTHSTNIELRLKEKQSQITSILKKQDNKTIRGMLGFGSLLTGTTNNAFNAITINGIYTEKSISGLFSATLMHDGKEYESTGSFTMTLF